MFRLEYSGEFPHTVSFYVKRSSGDPTHLSGPSEKERVLGKISSQTWRSVESFIGRGERKVLDF